MFKSVVHQSRGSGGGAGLGACLVENVDSSDAPHPKSNYVPTLSPSSIGLCQTVVHLSPNNHLNNDHHQIEDHFISNNHGFFTSKFTYYTLVLILTFGITMLIIVPLGSTFLFIDYQQQLAQRKFNKSDFCKSKCQYGAECIVDEYTNQAYCRCPLSCPDDYQPVCGSDKITYINQCHLNYESCNKQQIIQIISNGTCDSVLCRNVTCQKNYQKCQVDENGLAQCVCSWQSICHNHHHNHNGVVNKEQGQVCGSNGKLYNSECEMYKYSCQHKQDIVSVDRRFCSKAKDPLDIRNSFSAATNKNQNNGIGGDDDGGNEDDDEEDDGDNSSRRKIVCGDQICHRYATCHHPSLPQQQQTVPLSTSLGPSRLTTMPTCQCLNNCSRYNNNEENSLVVCATNNRNYANECEMKQDACQRQLDLKVLHKGQCGQCDPPCKFYSKCQLNNMIPECACPQVCLRVDEPVCGDNGVTYENECELRVASCRIKKQINVQFNASCDLCHNIVCHHGATCFNGECLCTDNCQNNIVEPLCANDGNTYRNECEMNRMACNSKKELIALFYGRCEETSENYFAEEFSSLIQTENTDNYEAAVPSNTIDDLSTIVGRQTSHCDQKLQAEVEVCRNLEQKYSDKEESYVYICDNRIFKSKCEMIKYGCHNQTRLTNCSKYCHCYKNGIQMNSNFVATICDGSRGQCSCKEGFRGSNCDQCASKFWRHLNHLNSSLIIDCKPCNCNRMGSLSEECEDSRGKCKCKPGIKGHKCDRCPPNMNLTYHGCVETESSSLSNDVCSRKRCKNGAVCRVQQKQAVCVCQFNCNKVSVHHHHMHVCASDGSIHKSMCHFRQYACESQKKLQILRQCPS